MQSKPLSHSEKNIQMALLVGHPLINEVNVKHLMHVFYWSQDRIVFF